MRQDRPDRSGGNADRECVEDIVADLGHHQLARRPNAHALLPWTFFCQGGDPTGGDVLNSNVRHFKSLRLDDIDANRPAILCRW